MSYKSDFHIHTYYSDGTMKPTDLVRMYHERGYDVIAITDHDGVDGVKEAVIAGEALKLTVVAGIEFSTEYRMKTGSLSVPLHILGYYIDIENEKLKEKLTRLAETRKSRNDRLLEYLNDRGYRLTYDDLLKRKGQTYVGKPNFARALEKKGYSMDGIWDTFDEIKREKLPAEEAIELIKDATGIAVLAHPMKIKSFGEPGSEEFFGNLDMLLEELKKAGLKGLECYHPSAKPEDSLRLVTLAGKYHLHITEGSDFHGE